MGHTMNNHKFKEFLRPDHQLVSPDAVCIYQKNSQETGDLDKIYRLFLEKGNGSLRLVRK
jgi:hypothetical protein